MHIIVVGSDQEDHKGGCLLCADGPVGGTVQPGWQPERRAFWSGQEQGQTRTCEETLGPVSAFMCLQPLWCRWPPGLLLFSQNFNTLAQLSEKSKKETGRNCKSESSPTAIRQASRSVRWPCLAPDTSLQSTQRDAPSLPPSNSQADFFCC